MQERKTLFTETGFQLFNRIHGQIRPRLENVFPEIFPAEVGQLSNKIIQITGAPNTGKSLLICELILNTILPTEISPKFKQCSAIFINTDHQISIIQMIKIAEKKLSILNIPQIDHQEIIKASLKRLTILNCYSSEQLENTMLNLEHLLSDNLHVALVAIDSLSAYYWEARYEHTLKQNKIYSVNQHCSLLLKMLKNVVNERNVATVFSKYETETSLISFVDFTVILGCINKDCNEYRIELYQLVDHQDHIGRTKLVKTYTIDSVFVFKH